MGAQKATGRATESVNAPHGIDQLGGWIDHEATTPAKLGAQAPDREAIRPDISGIGDRRIGRWTLISLDPTGKRALCRVRSHVREVAPASPGRAFS